MSDPRRLLMREGAAALPLQGVVAAESWREPTPMTARRAAPLHAEPDLRSERHDTVLVGEVFEVLETARGWAFGQARRDGYVGWVEQGGLAPGAETPTHRIASVRSLAFAAPSPRATPRLRLALNALVRVTEVRNGFAEAAHLGWIPEAHLAPIGRFEADPAAVAGRFAGSPYLWGGRDPEGIDCSGLVQAALYACGRSCPRDSDQQAGLGVGIGREALGRGDLVLWPGHVGIMADGARLIHASGFQMAVVVEPLAEAIATRLEKVGEPIAYRRL